MNGASLARTASASESRWQWSANSGFSLVEVMVGLTAGLILIAGVGQIYLGSRETYRLQEAQARLQEDGRFVVEYLKGSVRAAGYRSFPWQTQDTVFPPKAAAPTFGIGQIVTGGASSITVRFQGHPSGLTGGCLGGQITTSEVAQGTFEVDTLDVDMDADELECTVVQCLPPPASSCGTPSTQPVASNFGNFAVRFGLDTDSDRAVNEYVLAANVPSGSWNQVVSVRISFELRSEEGVTASPATYVFNGETATDRRLRRSFEMTIALRNQLP